MRPVQKAALSTAALSLVLLTACGSPSTSSGGATTGPSAGVGAPSAPATVSKPLNKPEDLKLLDTVTVTDDPAKGPSLTFAKPPLQVSATAVKVLKEGTGPESTAKSAVAVKQALFLGKDGKQLDSNFVSGPPSYFRLSSQQTIPGLLSAFTGVRQGSRILFAIPPAEAFGSQGRPELGIGGTDDLVVVADVVSVSTPLESAQGTAVPAVPGLPTVTFDPATGPAVTVPKTPPPAELVSQLLVDGTGPEVKAGQNVVVHYTGVLWKDGSKFDSSWARKDPFSFQVGAQPSQVIPAWDKGFVGKKVGSRVLLVVPPKEGYGDKGSPPKIAGTDTLVFVVDILEVY